MVLYELISKRINNITCCLCTARAHLSSVSPFPNKIVGLWLLGCAGVVYGTVAVGGLTRLTESGLSMVKWDLIKTMKPPLNQNQWEMEFENYKQYPEYKYKSDTNKEITLDQFKFIWTMEYLHRMLGRTVGLVFLVPCTYFWFRGHFSKRIKRRMLFAGLLIFTQGIIGWWMVKSGLKQKDLNEDSFVPRVSHYRLAVHLSLAFILYGVFLWNGLSCLLTPFDHSNVKSIKRLRGMVHGSKLAIFSTVFIGAFVAGLDAGLVYNSWPTYSGNWIPHELMSGTICGISEFFSNPVSVQFIHRNLAYLTLVVVLLTWIKGFNCTLSLSFKLGRKMLLSNRARLALHSLLVASLLQASLGIGTLVYEVPIPAASAHQNGALILYSIVIWLANEIRKIPK